MTESKMRLLLSLAPCFLALPALAPASPWTALKRYEKGRYESALLEYKRLLMEKPDDPRLHFNAGTAAFQVQDFEEAGKQLNAALAAQDLQLQERAYYNLGNTEYRLGATAPALEKKQTHWEQAISSYESALKLNPQDEDAKFNLKLVKQKLEELPKQKQQENQQSKDDQKDQSKQDKSKQDQSKQDQQSKEDQKKQQDQKKGDEQKPQPGQDKEDKKPEDSQAQQKPDASKDDKKQAESQPGKESKEKNPDQPEDQQAQAGKAMMVQMTPQEARQLLDAQKSEEKAMIFIPKLKTNRTDRAFKDW